MCTQHCKTKKFFSLSVFLEYQQTRTLFLHLAWVLQINARTSDRKKKYVQRIFVPVSREEEKNERREEKNHQPWNVLSSTLM